VASKAIEARFRRLKEMGCVVCGAVLGLGYRDADIHHLVDKGDRAKSGGDMATIPLCLWHHRGIPPEGHSEAWALQNMGPSIALHGKTFNRTYGQRKLLGIVNSLLGMECAA